MKRAIILLLSLFAICTIVDVSAADEPLAVFSATVDLGEDRGQNFGSVFEARDGRGRVVAGAGFMGVYNTRFRNDRRTLQFFVRPEKEAGKFAVERLPHPDLDCGVYLLDVNQRLFAWSSHGENFLRGWDAAARRWKKVKPPATGSVGSGDAVIRIGGGTLVVTGNRATYFDSHQLPANSDDSVSVSPAGVGRLVLEAPAVGRYYNFYYAAGHLCFYHTHRTDDGGFTKVHACRWSPQTEDPIDVSRATTLQAKYVGETPFAWGQFQNDVLTVSNMGGVYVFDGIDWRALRESLKGVSFQVYSMLNYHDRLLLAQYPTGELFEYEGKKLKQLKGWPPRLPGVSPSAREAQTLAIYGGELFVGVWPWAELWRYDRDGENWHSMGRMFSHPEITDKMVHPYEPEAKRHRLVTNHWGQRITGMVPLGDSLMLSTSSKGTYRWYDKYKFLTEKQRREYGAVLRLKMPGNLATQIKWKDKPTRFEFVVEKNRIVVRQDGVELASSKISSSQQARLKSGKVTWGRGVFGPLNGRLLKTSTR
ncbi:MAG: hypothetical protein HOL01_00625 [Planctomycetaceae bacterium]|jgi:hypothetical protein|nr:hypothetical protein [Planctomycetaceae bacterium]MBT6493028.1 hypothetical protein [Planctomycetaceae bacterium]